MAPEATPVLIAYDGSEVSRSAVPPAGAPRPEAPGHDPAETLRELTELHQRGVLTDAEFEGLRARLRV